MKAAIYARVSTAGNGQDPRLQVDALEEFCARRGWAIVDRYVDHGVSGVKDSRPQLNRLMADAKNRRFDVIAVWKVDRFSRSLAHLVNALHELHALGVSFYSYTDQLDFTTPAGRAMFQIIGVFAEFERSLIAERVAAGMAAARAAGVRLGRPPATLPAGITDAMVAARKAEGASWPQLEKEFGANMWSLRQAVARHRKNRAGKPVGASPGVENWRDGRLARQRPAKKL